MREFARDAWRELAALDWRERALREMVLPGLPPGTVRALRRSSDMTFRRSYFAVVVVAVRCCLLLLLLWLFGRCLAGEAEPWWGWDVE